MAYENIAYIAYTRSELIKMGTLLTEADIPWIHVKPGTDAGKLPRSGGACTGKVHQ